MQFVIADLHFGDGRTETARRRLLPDVTDVSGELARRWNAVVADTDTVFVLGDIGRSGIASMVHLPGRKHLVAGNADNLISAVRSGLFASVSVAKWMNGLLLTHLPVHPTLLRGATLNIHGHLHGRALPDPRYRCVSVEQTGLAPIPLEKVVKQLP